MAPNERRANHETCGPLSACRCGCVPDFPGGASDRLFRLPGLESDSDRGPSAGGWRLRVAILDVAKHLLEEEVLAWREPHRATNFRPNFSRFISIILIAIFLEGLVLVFKVTQDDIKLMVYPVLLLSVGAAMMIGLAVFQRLGSDPEKAGARLE
jgi:hypothetical protein